MTEYIQLPAYTKDAFIERGEEIKQVETALENIDQPQRTRVIVFRGERGNGKTWLALHLHRLVLAENPKVFSVFINLSAFPKEYKQGQIKRELCLDSDGSYAKPPKDIAEDFMKRLLDTLEIETHSESTLGGMKQDLINGLEQKIKEYVFVLIADSVFEADWQLLDILEEYLFAPVAWLPRTLIIMTGRGKIYPWISAYLRVDTQEKFLEEFKEPGMVEKQLALLWPGKKIPADEILQLGGGSPMTNYLLGRGENPKENLKDAVDYQLSILPQGEPGRMAREALEALSLLDNFREDEMSKMLEAYKKPGMVLEEIRNLRDRLVDAHLLRWKDGGFELDRSIRHLLQNYLYISEHTLWETLKKAAEDIYTGLANRYPRHKEFYEQKKEAIDHISGRIAAQ